MQVAELLGVSYPRVVYNVLLQPYSFELDDWLAQNLIVECIAMI